MLNSNVRALPSHSPLDPAALLHFSTNLRGGKEQCSRVAASLDFAWSLALSSLVGMALGEIEREKNDLIIRRFLYTFWCCRAA